MTKVDVRGTATGDNTSPKDYDPEDGGLRAVYGAVDGKECPSTHTYKECIKDDDKDQKFLKDNKDAVCCKQTKESKGSCDGNPETSDNLYHIGKCFVEDGKSISEDGSVKMNLNTSTCGPVQVIEFPGGKMILEYEPGEDNVPCEGGYFLPFFAGEFMWGITAHTIIYAFTLGFSFFGIAIIADVFMAAIEVITSKTKKIVTVNPDGTEKTIEFLVWNETIANLTLMALGSSAPEILLSTIETLALTNAEAVPGGLGPGTIVGSAAFNLLVIIAICVMAIPKPEGEETGFRKIKAMKVFTCTAFFSVFAYIWLFIVVMDNNVDLWEAIVTFMFFPVLVVLAFMLDKSGQKKEAVIPDDINDGSGGQAHITGTSGMGARGYGNSQDLAKKLATLKAAEGISGLLAKKAGGEKIAEDKKKLAAMAVAEIQSEQKVSVMQAKINARRGLAGRQRTVAGAGDADALQALKKIGEDKRNQERDAMTAAADKNTTYVSFASAVYSVDENKGKVSVDVLRFGNLDSEISVYYTTVDGEAISGSDFKFTRGDIKFKKGEERKSIEVELIDDNDYEPDEAFYIELHQPKQGKKGTPSEAFEFKGHTITTVTILNDDKPGTFSFEKAAYSVSEASGKVKMKVIRTNGADGDVQVKVTTSDGTAKSGNDYVKYEEVITFKDMQSAHEFEIELVASEEYEKEESFQVEMTLISEGLDRGEHMRSVVTIVADEDYAQLVEQVAELMALQFDNLSLETTTWADQFDEAMNIQGEEGQSPTTTDYVMHFLTFGWKVMFATVPPTSVGGGWVTFFVALIYIGVLTAFVADIASIFGCLLGLPDAITAITFVALGTSLPDTFASKTAAVNDDTADASVGNVTGSNSVNVFLGLGLPWLLATIINTSAKFTPENTGGNSGAFPLIAGSLGFSVVIFSICAIVCIATLYIRRAVVGCELGGGLKYPTGALFIGLWLVYVLCSSLETLGTIENFMA